MLWEAVTKSVDPKMLACTGASPGQVRVASRCMLLAAAALYGEMLWYAGFLRQHHACVF